MQVSQEHLVLHVLPLLVRAYDDNDARMQEEGLKRTSSLVKQLDAQVIATCHSYKLCSSCKASSCAIVLVLVVLLLWSSCVNSYLDTC